MEATTGIRSLVESLVREAVLGRLFGSTRVQAIDVTLQDDWTGEPAIFIELTLPEPAAPTWPTEDTQELRRTVRELITGELPGLMFYTQFRVGAPASA